MALCTTPACTSVANNILQNMSPDYQQLDPCENFYKYSCGGFDASHELNGRIVVSTLDDMQMSVWTVVKDILEKPISAGTLMDFHDLVKVRDAYRACMNETAIHEKGYEPLLNLTLDLEKAYGPDDFDLAAGVKFLLDLDQDVLINPQLDADASGHLSVKLTTSALGPYIKGETRNQQISGKPNLPLDAFGRERAVTTHFSIDDPIWDAYADVIRKTLDQWSTKVGPYPGPVSSDKQLSNFSRLFEFEKQLGNLSSSWLVDSGLLRTMTADEITELLPEIPLSSIIKISDPEAATKITFTANPGSLESLSTLLKATAPDVLRLYMQWRLLVAFHPYVDSEIFEPLRQFRKKFLKVESLSEPERWATCVEGVSFDFTEVIAPKYFEAKFPESRKKFGEQVIEDIRTKFEQELNGSTWMSAKVQRQATLKVQNLRQSVGYPRTPNSTEADQLRVLYSHLNLSSDSYFSNEVSLKRSAVSEQWKILQIPTFTAPIGAVEKELPAILVNVWMILVLEDVVYL